ncbi:SDR family oxidoreductase [Paenibacillus sp. 28ISP30-2]|uniref:SDR family NAD(P)-dependent oxidoreductase n=1 Tax=Paenibacillus sp. 23TSA30-6 TaxID=2546104 RepID=UPI001787F1A8|nr:SDR family oxidoreductase [Paenibacillus sp. 23TSA30-6]MBE0336116.1 SDR family oxidoreductase [Paenibacillus sp. 23TSA30-6]MBE0339848.1 SDR family oxidoreductase [Paenibacillus sp. 28ISP30-2]
MATTKHHKTALITGANSGVGLELTLKLLSEGWHVLALIRSGFPNDNESRVQHALSTGQLRIYKADLADFSSLKKALEQIQKSESHIDVLFNNAGVSLGEMIFSPLGREMHFEVNTVVPYIIFMELKELLRQGNLRTVINTSSNASLIVKRFEVELLERPAEFKKLFGPYASSKLALSLWTQEIAPAATAEGIKIRSVCPGANKTTMTSSSGMPGYMIPIRNLIFSHPSKGASRLYKAALGEFSEQTGIFLKKGKVTPLIFNQHSSQVLSKVDQIYKQQFIEFT